MATKNYDSFRDLKKGKYDWKVTARIMNLWRGYTKKGEPFQSCNLLLLDNKRFRIHAFVPGNIAVVLEPTLQVGNVYLFKNFTVKEYKDEEKFRPIRKHIQIVLSNETKVIDLDEKEVVIEQAAFDFYDFGDLKQLAMQTTYLTGKPSDIIGVIKDRDPTLAKFENKFGQLQTQIRFYITDGRNTVKVTFWDAFAELFAEALKEDNVYPRIIIIGSGRVTEWKEKLDVSNVGATTFYLNYNHHSVIQMRKMLQDPLFDEYHISSRRDAPLRICTVVDIKNLGVGDIQSEVLCVLKIDQVPDMETWFRYVCTSCYREMKLVGKEYYCMFCKTNKPHPDKWYELWLLASDATGQVDIILENVAGRKCIGKSAREICDLELGDGFPQILKNIETKEYTVKLLIREENVVQKSKVYFAKDIMEGPYNAEQYIDNEGTELRPIQESYAEASSSSYHLESMSENQ